MRLAIICILAIIFAVLCAEAKSIARRRTWKVRKCVESKTVHCKYTRKCVRAGVKCLKRKSVRRCARYGLKKVHRITKKRVCLRFIKTGNKFRRAGICTRCAKWGVRVVRFGTKKSVCVRYHRKRLCLKRKRVCKKSRAVKSCWVVEHKFRLVGPKRCRKGFYLKFTRKGRTIRRRCVRGVRRVQLKECWSALDPHTRLGGNRWFEYQVTGDRLMAETNDGVFAVHQRLKRFAVSWTGTIGMAVLVNGRDVVEYLGHGKFFLNGKPINVNFNSQLHLPEGGYLIRKRHGGQSVVEVFSPNGAKAVYFDFGPYANLFTYVPTNLSVKGYCSGNNLNYWLKTTARGLFSFVQKIRFTRKAMRRVIRKIKVTRAQRKRAIARCRAVAKGGLFRECVKDVIAAHGQPGAARRILKIIKDIRREARQGRNDKPRRR